MLAELQLHRYKARVYDSLLGRFLQTDPVGYEDGLNLYLYVGGDPLNSADPTGRLRCSGSGKCKTVLSDARQAAQRLRDASRRLNNLARALETGRFDAESRATRDAFVRAYGRTNLSADNATEIADRAERSADWLDADSTYVVWGGDIGGARASVLGDRLILYRGYFRNRDGDFRTESERVGTMIHEGGHGGGLGRDFHPFSWRGVDYSRTGAAGIRAMQQSGEALGAADALRCAVYPASGDCP